VRLVAAIGTGLLEPPDPVTGSWTTEPPGQPDLPGILAGWQDRGLVPQDAAPAAAVQRAHECGADGHLAGALRELLG
jgi:hypothetical protein